MSRTPNDAPNDFARLVSSEIRREMGNLRLSGRGLAVIIGKSEKYVRERMKDLYEFSLNDVEMFARHIEVQPEEFIARIERNATSNVTPIRNVAPITEDEAIALGAVAKEQVEENDDDQ